MIIFKIQSTRRQIIGVLIGFFGTYLLITSGLKLNPDQNYNYAGLVILCSFLYALNVNIIKKYLQHLSAITITVGHFTAIIIPAIILRVLEFSNNIFPIKDAVAPKLINTSEKPRENKLSLIHISEPTRPY